METEDSIVNDSGQRKVVKKLSEVDPDVRVTVLAKALIVEAVHLGDLTDLVVSTENGQSILKTHFQGDKESNSLYGVVSAIDIISHEKVVCVWGLSAYLEKFLQVVELSVDITADRNWWAYWLHVRFVDQDFLSLLAKGFHLLLGQRLALKEDSNLLFEVLNILVRLHRSGTFRLHLNIFLV